MPRRTAFQEPGMQVGGVVRHEVEQQLQSSPVDRMQQLVEIAKRSEQRLDVGVIGNVIAEIGHRRAKDRREPDGADAELDEIIQAPQDAVEIPDTVAIAVLKRAWINLINCRGSPPFGPVRCKLVHCDSHSSRSLVIGDLFARPSGSTRHAKPARSGLIASAERRIGTLEPGSELTFATILDRVGVSVGVVS